jgi:hypothetical protein
MRSASWRVGVLVVSIVFLAAGSARAGKFKSTYFVGFEDGINEGGWTFGNPFIETRELEGGNPGAYIRSNLLDTFAAQPRTTLGLRRSIFHGDYRARGVTFVAIDLAVFSVDFSTQGRPLSLILFDDGGTPDVAIDDCSVFRVGGHPTPMPNGTWQPYRFRVPAHSTTLPPGWALQGCPGLTEDEAWNRVITGVDQLRFFTGDPEGIFIFQVWDIGLDNPRITWEPQFPIVP